MNTGQLGSFQCLMRLPKGPKRCRFPCPSAGTHGWAVIEPLLGSPSSSLFTSSSLGSAGTHQGSMGSPELIPSRNNTVWGFKRSFLGLKSFQVTPCQPANSELEEFINSKTPFCFLITSMLVSLVPSRSGLCLSQRQDPSLWFPLVSH